MSLIKNLRNDEEKEKNNSIASIKGTIHSLNSPLSINTDSD